MMLEMPEAPAAVQGTQAIDRAIRLMRRIAAEGAAGARLTDLARAAELVPPTARRILKRLIDHGVVAQDPDTQRYFLGTLTYELGLAASHRVDLAARMRPMLMRIAELSGDTAYLVIRSGTEAVCIDRVEGSYPIKTLTLKVGDRVPLGLSAGSLAILAVLPEADAESVIAANRAAFLAGGRLTESMLRDDLTKARERGYALRRNAIADGAIGLGVVVPNGDMPPFAGVSLAMVLGRLSEARRNELVAMMKSVLRAGLPGM
jgi:DNA-binding IclR family transcriptional regulator